MSYDRDMVRENIFAGRKVERYSIREVIGKGAIGEVYSAFDDRLLRPVAIKITFPETAKASVLVDRIVREAQIMARLEHANIVPIYDVIDHAGSVFIVMRLVRGKSLEQIIGGTRGPKSVYEACRIMQQTILGPLTVQKWADICYT